MICPRLEHDDVLAWCWYTYLHSNSICIYTNWSINLYEQKIFAHGQGLFWWQLWEVDSWFFKLKKSPKWWNSVKMHPVKMAWPYKLPYWYWCHHWHKLTWHKVYGDIFWMLAPNNNVKKKPFSSRRYYISDIISQFGDQFDDQNDKKLSSISWNFHHNISSSASVTNIDVALKIFEWFIAWFFIRTLNLKENKFQYAKIRNLENL